MDFSVYLKTLADANRPLMVAELKQLSDLDIQQAAAFQIVWQQIDSERRLTIVQELDELAEDNVDLDFRTVFLVCLADQNAEVQIAAIDGLWEDERTSTMDQLLALTGDASGDVRAAAVVGLSRFAFRAAVGQLAPAATERLYQALLALAGDPEQPLEVRRRSVEGLGYFADSPEAQAEIGRAYAHEEQLMRESALVAMGRSMRPTWFPYIQRELGSRSPALRYEAARAVGELGEEGRPMVEALLPLVEDDDLEVALASVWALGQVGGPHARRVLQRLTRSRDTARSQAAAEALEELSLDEL